MKLGLRHLLPLTCCSLIMGCHSSSNTAIPELTPPEVAGLGQVSAPSSAPATGILGRERLTMASVVNVNLSNHTATLPLYKGTAKGQTVWYIIQDVSDQATATALGINFAPRLAATMSGCPGCIQEVQSSDPVLGKGTVVFAGGVDFSPTRALVAGPTEFPPQSATPGAVGDAEYSPLVRIAGQTMVYNISIVASGNGPFDVTTHTNTHDRLVGIDTTKMTVDLLFVRAFALGRNILYLSQEATDGAAATIERATFVPGLSGLPFANLTNDSTKSARASLFAFVNGKTGPTSPPAQGLNHVIADGGNAGDASDPSIRELLRTGGDAHNVLDFFPTESDPTLRALYSPMWDVHFAQWSDAAIKANLNGAQSDANIIRTLANQGLITSPGGAALGSANVVVDCSALAYLDNVPTAPLIATPANAN